MDGPFRLVDRMVRLADFGYLFRPAWLRAQDSLYFVQPSYMPLPIVRTNSERSGMSRVNVVNHVTPLTRAPSRPWDEWNRWYGWDGGDHIPRLPWPPGSPLTRPATPRVCSQPPRRASRHLRSISSVATGRSAIAGPDGVRSHARSRRFSSLTMSRAARSVGTSRICSSTTDALPGSAPVPSGVARRGHWPPRTYRRRR